MNCQCGYHAPTCVCKYVHSRTAVHGRHVCWSPANSQVCSTHKPVLQRQICQEQTWCLLHKRTSDNCLLCRFIAALTRGGPNGMPRPIEMNAHDPRRYLGDMLAWVHQALASERELLISLFGQDNQSRTSGSHADSPSDVPSSSALLDKVLEGVCRPLKVSIHALLFTFSLPCLFLGISLGDLPLQDCTAL